MKIAFYAPLKPPSHPVPSGDRAMARLMMTALERAGHEVEVASRLRAREGAGDAQAQGQIAAIGRQQAERLIRRWQALPSPRRPSLWLTYHLYYKAPDWIGPRVAGALAIPYVVAEASHAPKRAAGPWAEGHAAVEAAIRRADGVIALNPADLGCVCPLLAAQDRLVLVKPFLDDAPFQAAATQRARHRRALALAHGLDPGQPWLLAVGMMRPGDKLASYRVLGEALAALADRRWQLLVVGDGPARREVEAALAPLGQDRLRFAGLLARDRLAEAYAGADLLVWPAINEAYGMALLEAQAAGLPVVAGDSAGVGTIVASGATGLLTPPGDAAAFARAVRLLLEAPRRCQQMRHAALAKVAADHRLAVAAATLDRLLTAACERARHEAASPAPLTAAG
ncbi:MAG: glycosyltransferase family 4 protein [Pseudomonadota bacterium]